MASSDLNAGRLVNRLGRTEPTTLRDIEEVVAAILGLP